ncbi:hypothetical protein DBV39_02465 [Orrella marina]|uniref:Uncharacterized protein n=1 Tax=Orrella marina TaxID=2163011 RepID=A0A2R4XG24_9BURK|nr:hypothetical protein DBV39_02465 [Orrella marina]
MIRARRLIFVHERAGGIVIFRFDRRNEREFPGRSVMKMEFTVQSPATEPSVEMEATLSVQI